VVNRSPGGHGNEAHGLWAIEELPVPVCEPTCHESGDGDHVFGIEVEVIGELNAQELPVAPYYETPAVE
jgi:hypothetical protein